MTVMPESAAAAWEYGGETYYFCSAGCFERFRADPEDYVGKDPSERHM